MSDRILVWDLPLRIFHWVLAASFAGAFLTAESERLRDLHVLFGYTFGGAIAFRLVWGFVGTRYARFSALRFGPAAIVRTFRSLLAGQGERHVGHGPVAVVMIPLLLGLGLVVAASGIASNAGAGGEGLEELHEAASVVLLGVVVAHVLGVLVMSFVQRENLVLPLLSGRKPGAPGAGIRGSHRLVGLLLLAALAALWVPGISAREAALAKQTSAVAEAGGDRESQDD